MSSKISFDHFRIGAHIRSRTFGKHAALIEHQHPIGYTHHKLHVVLDKHDRHTFIGDLADEHLNLFGLDRIAAGRRLVKQQNGRFGRERARFPTA